MLHIIELDELALALRGWLKGAQQAGDTEEFEMAREIVQRVGPKLGKENFELLMSGK